jgi:glycosyltransferase involved in cell wall biosynthesis
MRPRTPTHLRGKPGGSLGNDIGPSLISLILPTRQRPGQLRRLLDSLADTTTHPEALEVLLVIDTDDPESQAVADQRLALRRVIVPPGQTMGSLNRAGYEASRGRYLMLLNDDVVARTSGWDDAVRLCFASYPDEILLVHVNDLVFQKHLCTFPIVSRTFCEIVGGICPREYVRYRIDDHIEDHFNMLQALGERRIIFAPQVVFEHEHYVENAGGLRQYFSDPAILGVDALLFDELLAQRKESILRLKARIVGRSAIPGRWRRKLDRIRNPLALRMPGRQRILTSDGIVDPGDLEPSSWERLRGCARDKGWRGVTAALARRAARWVAPRSQI